MSSFQHNTKKGGLSIHSVKNIIADEAPKNKVLEDFTKTGKERKWRSYKMGADILANSYIRLGDFYRADRILDCGSSLKFNVCPDGHEQRLAWASFCRERLCPMCANRRSIKIAHQVKRVAHELAKRKKVRWIMLTLTVDNPSAAELNDTIDLMMKAWHKLARRKVFKDNVVGWMRSMEITAEKKREGYYHPHFHVLLAVRPSYFKGGNYLSQENWTEVWKSCLKVDYTPIVHVTAVKQKRRNVAREQELLEKKGFEIRDGTISELPAAAVAEVAKYTVKSDDFFEYKEDEFSGEKRLDENKTDDNVKLLTKVLRGRRLFAFGLELKEIWNELNLDDVEDEKADLVHTQDEDQVCKCSVCASDMLEKIYAWDEKKRNYFLKD